MRLVVFAAPAEGVGSLTIAERTFATPPPRRHARLWSFLADAPSPDARTRSIPKRKRPMPGVEWPASGGHTGASRSSLGRKRSGSVDVNRESVRTHSKAAAKRSP